MSFFVEKSFLLLFTSILGVTTVLAFQPDDHPVGTLISKRAAATLDTTAKAPETKASPLRPVVHIDWNNDRITASIHTPNSPAATKASLVHAVAERVKIMPVLPGETLSALVLRNPSVNTAFESWLESASTAEEPQADPGLRKITVQLPFARLRRILAPELSAGILGTGLGLTEDSKSAQGPVHEQAAGIIVELAGEDRHSPGLLPLLASYNSKKTALIQALVGKLIVRGARVRHPGKAPNTPGYKRFTANYAGGLGRACLFLDDVQCDRLIESLEKAGKTKGFVICIPLQSVVSGKQSSSPRTGHGLPSRQAGHTTKQRTCTGAAKTGTSPL